MRLFFHAELIAISRIVSIYIGHVHRKSTGEGALTSLILRNQNHEVERKFLSRIFLCLLASSNCHEILLCSSISEVKKDFLLCTDSHGISPAQVLLRWSIQRGFVPLPKASSEKRIAENIDLFGFELSEQEMQTLDGLEQNFVTAWDPSETDPV